MKKLLTLIILAASLSASSQNIVDWIGDQYTQTDWALRGTTDGGYNYQEVIVVDTSEMQINTDSLRWVSPDSSRLGTVPDMLLAIDGNGYIWPVELEDLFSFQEGDGIDVSVVGNVITISLEEPEMSMGAPMKNGMQPLVWRVEYYGLDGSFLGNDLPTNAGTYVIWNYMTDGTIRKEGIQK